MGYVYTGERRSLTFTINKTNNGVQVLGYPKTYDGQAGDWSLDYPAITDTQLARMSTAEYNARKAAFLAYVQTEEPGFVPGTHFINASTNTNLSLCPIPATTTTTTL